MTDIFDAQIDYARRIIQIQGIRYSFELFDALGMGPIGAQFEIIARDDGVVTLKSLNSISRRATENV